MWEVKITAKGADVYYRGVFLGKQRLPSYITQFMAAVVDAMVLAYSARNGAIQPPKPKVEQL